MSKWLRCKCDDNFLRRRSLSQSHADADASALPGGFRWPGALSWDAWPQGCHYELPTGWFREAVPYRGPVAHPARSRYLRALSEEHSSGSVQGVGWIGYGVSFERNLCPIGFVISLFRFNLGRVRVGISFAPSSIQLCYNRRQFRCTWASWMRCHVNSWKCS